MWTIPKPNISALDSFNTCVEGVRNKSIKIRLQAVAPEIIAAEMAFDQAAASVDLHRITPQTHIANSVTAKEMKYLYNVHMARDGSRGHSIYDSILIASPDDRCPFCGHRTVSTLDHCLPKAQHPALAVTPLNLIPACKDCNHSKGNPALTVKADQLLNAYYDDVTTDTWLYAEIVVGKPAGVRYYVNSPPGWGKTTKKRIEHHFRELKLAELYASQGGRQLRNIRRSLRKCYAAGGAAAVREDLLGRHESYSEIELNSWEIALYRATAESDWYCDGGFDG
jgi:hypothetical protein